MSLLCSEPIKASKVEIVAANFTVVFTS